MNDLRNRHLTVKIPASIDLVGVVDAGFVGDSGATRVLEEEFTRRVGDGGASSSQKLSSKSVTSMV